MRAYVLKRNKDAHHDNHSKHCNHLRGSARESTDTNLLQLEAEPGSDRLDDSRSAALLSALYVIDVNMFLLDYLQLHQCLLYTFMYPSSSCLLVIIIIIILQETLGLLAICHNIYSNAKTAASGSYSKQELSWQLAIPRVGIATRFALPRQLQLVSMEHCESSLEC